MSGLLNVRVTLLIVSPTPFRPYWTSVTVAPETVVVA